MPAFTGVDDSLYGSLAIYQKEIVDELRMWMDNHSEVDMDQAVREAIEILVQDNEKNAYISAWEEILESK